TPAHLKSQGAINPSTTTLHHGGSRHTAPAAPRQQNRAGNRDQPAAASSRSRRSQNDAAFVLHRVTHLRREAPPHTTAAVMSTNDVQQSQETVGQEQGSQIASSREKLILLGIIVP
ncbi:hypothetical protein PIB30_101732, partial [Stylosanthes scabra]|nr:hypothetical protein [Stylosanthes scabra]